MNWAVIGIRSTTRSAAWGEALLEADGGRVGKVEAVGVDKNRCSGGRAGSAPRLWCTSVVDVGGHQPVRHSPR